MQNILSRSCRSVLEHFIWSGVLLAFDFDGTLAPIVAVPKRARIGPKTARLCRRLQELYPCAVISSRTPKDLRPRVTQLEGWRSWSGMSRASSSVRRSIASWLVQLGRALSHIPRVEIEDKISRISVHYRRSRQKRRVIAAVERTASRFRGVRLIRGKQAIHVQPENAADKGKAVLDLCRKLRCATVIYVGDDAPDEDVFGLNLPGRLLGIRVGRSASSQARFFLQSRRHVDDLIALLVELRSNVGERTGLTSPRPFSRGRAIQFSRTEHVEGILNALRELDHWRDVRSRILEEERGVTAQQVAVLRRVGQAPGVVASDLAAAMHVHPSALTPVVRSLLDHGLIRRVSDNVDARRKTLWLTARGRQLDVPLDGTLELALAAAARRCPNADLAATRSVLTQIVASIGTPRTTARRGRNGVMH